MIPESAADVTCFKSRSRHRITIAMRSDTSFRREDSLRFGVAATLWFVRVQVAGGTPTPRDSCEILGKDNTMCGFAGFVDREARPSDKNKRLEVVHAMAAQLSRRGPDDEQRFDDDRMTFAFRRLSIVDVEHGSQPIWNEDKTLFVSVNGEIYNHVALRSMLRDPHQFRTSSDSEIALHLYEERGPEMLSLLNGIFAIVIWDTRRRELFLARDRLGVKPLYYAEIGSKFLFGSELKALLSHPDCPRNMSWSDTNAILRSEITYKSLSFVDGIESLPGGHFLLLGEDGTSRVRKYWSVEDNFPAEGVPPKTENEYIEGYHDLFSDAVRLQLMSDVPLGIFLSGGLDSCAIVAAAAKHTRNLHCYTLVEDTVLRTGDAAAARLLCERLDLPLHQVWFDPSRYTGAQRLSLETFEYLMWMVERPIFDPEFLFKHELHRFAKTITPDLKVILLGQGSDEFTGGYSREYKQPAADWDSFLRRSLSYSVSPRLQPLIGERYGVSDTKFFKHSPFQQMMCASASSLQAFNLWHEDRTSSSQGIEARVPFLDHRLVEYLAAIPPQLHAKLFWDKRIVREACAPLLPDELRYRQKVGFFQSPEMNVLYRMFFKMVIDMFDEYCEKYLSGSDALFSRVQLTELLRKGIAGEKPLPEVVQDIGACICISIFDRLCRTMHLNPKISYMTPPSPLEELKTLPSFTA